MQQAVTITLRAGPDEASSVPGMLHLLSPLQRAGRAIATLGGFLVVAALLIPIPIIHLIGIPLAVLLGLVMAVRQGRCVARLVRTAVPCPRCGERNYVGGGLGYRTATGPIPMPCSSCRRALALEWGEG